MNLCCKIICATIAIVGASSMFAANDEKSVELKIELPPAVITGTPMPINIPAAKLDTTRRPALKLPKGCVNLALGKPVSSSFPHPIVGELAYLTDGDKDGDEGYEVELAPGAQWIQIDLGSSAQIYAIALWHYHRQKRAYSDVVVMISDDSKFEKNTETVFNNDYDNSLKFGVGKDKVYIETNAGKLIPVNGVKGRYVRFYSNGNTSDRGNHYIEAEVYGKR